MEMHAGKMTTAPSTAPTSVEMVVANKLGVREHDSSQVAGVACDANQERNAGMGMAGSSRGPEMWHNDGDRKHSSLEIVARC